MSIKKVLLLLIPRQQITHFNKIRTSFLPINQYQQSFAMQRSLLSFFKPLSEKSQNNGVVPSKKDENAETEKPAIQKEKSSPPVQKKSVEKPSKKSTSKVKKSPTVQKKPKTEKSPRTYSKKSTSKSSPIASKKSEEKSQQQSLDKLLPEKEDSPTSKDESKEETSPKRSRDKPTRKEENSPIAKKKSKKENSPEASPKKLPQKDETSPIVQKKRKRIIALESDSDGDDVNETSPKHEKKKALTANDSVDEQEEVIENEESVVKSESEEEGKDDVSKNDGKSKNEKKAWTVAASKIGSKKKTGKTNKKSKEGTKKKGSVTSKVNAKETKIDDIEWKHGEKTPYLSLAKTLQKVEDTSARLKIIDILADYFRNVILSNKADLLPSIYLCLNILAPAYEGLELGIADTYLMKAVAQCTGRSLAQIKADAGKIGDLGIVAEQSRSNQKLMFRPAALTVQGVFQQLLEIAKISGQNAVKRKIDKIQALFVSCRECEARFIIRTLAGKMRIGLAEQSVLQALALACTTTPPNQSDPLAVTDASKTMSPAEFKKQADEEALILKTTYCECPNYNLIVPALLEHGIRELPNYCKITPGLPVKPMLAQPTKGVHEVFQRFENIKFTCEWKYDGERAQIHVLEDGSIKIYSRNQEDNTSKYPDVIDEIRESFKSELKSCIIDAEAVAWDREQKRIMPFQILSTRKRKDADVSEIKVRVCVFLFDLLYVNGESLTQKPLSERRTLLKEHFQEVEEKFKFVTSIDTNTLEEVHEFLDESVKGNCEGLMVKTLDTEATYEIAKRSRNWLKLKKDYLEGCGDTLDLVVIGGYIGKGKRTGQYGGFLLASYDAENDEYQTICKIGTGFTEEALATHSEFLKQHVIEKPKPYYRYDSSHEPDQWFDTVQVWEIKCADLSLSPIYYSAIGLVDPDKGISLRFPRFLRIREDKTVEQATSSQQVAELYNNQDQIKNNAAANESKFNEEDF